MSDGINMNDMALWVTAREGGEQSLSIAQVKEVMRLTLVYLAVEMVEDGIDGVLELLKRVYNEKADTNRDPEDNVEGAVAESSEGQGTSEPEGG